MTDPREPFYVMEDDYRDTIKVRVAQLSDEELKAVGDLFAHHNLNDIPIRYHAVSWRVRAAVNIETRRRAVLAKEETHV